MEGGIELLLTWNSSCHPAGMMAGRHYVLGVCGWGGCGLCLFLSKFRGKVVPEREKSKDKGEVCYQHC